MRPQQQNRRMRGRNNNGGGGGNNNNNNNRKGPNPLTRNYESNGPDVKIRGSAQQIAEKYATLARDAQSSGDRVMAENYLQHAEHYNRIIAAAQAQLPIQNAQQNRDDFDDDEDRDDFDNAGNGNGGETQAPQAGNGPQPTIEGTPAELAYGQENSRENNNGRDNNGRNNNGRDNNGRNRDRRPNGGYGQNEQRGDFAQRGEQNGPRGDQQRFTETPVQTEAVSAVEPEAETGFSEPAPLYENLSPAALAARAELNEAAAENGAARRPRRPRRPRTNADQVSNDQSGGEQVDGASETAAATKVVDAAPAETPAVDPFVVDANN